MIPPLGSLESDEYARGISLVLTGSVSGVGLRLRPFGSQSYGSGDGYGLVELR